MRILIAIAALLIASDETPADSMRAHFVDVDQAASTILEFPCAIVLIDAGERLVANNKKPERLTGYLDAVFEQRPNLDRVIDTIMITHNHKDHTSALPEISKNYAIKNVVSTMHYLNDDIRGLEQSEPDIKLHYLTYEDAKDNFPKGFLYNEISPVECDTHGPTIRVFTGKSDITSAVNVFGYKFTKSHFWRSFHNNSLVIAVDYGKASFIFTGDMETKGIDYMLATYRNHREVFEADVFHVGQHGARKSLTRKLLNAIDPAISVISAGKPFETGPKSAMAFGHPRTSVVERLMMAPRTGQRTASIKGWAFSRSNKAPEPINIGRHIYCTCWENNIVIEASALSGQYTIQTDAKP